MTGHPTAGAMAMPSRPVLVGLYHVVPTGPDRVLVANAGRTIALSGPGLAAQVGPLLAAVDGTATREQLEARFPDLAGPVLAGLAAQGVLTDAAPTPDTSGGAPQLASVALTGAGSPAQVASRLAGSTVAVAGCGPVGGQVALLLAKAGVGRLVLADPVVARGPAIAVSAVLDPMDEGCSRAEATARHCQGANPAATVSVVAGPPEPEGEDALVVVELGYDGRGSATADRCLGGGGRYLVHSQDSLRCWIGPLVAVGGRPCHHCLESRRRSHLRRPGEDEAYRRHRAERCPGPDAYLAAHSAIAAGLVATEALRGLLGAQPLTEAAVVFVDLGTMGIHRELLHAVPGCPGCARAAGRP